MAATPVSTGSRRRAVAALALALAATVSGCAAIPTAGPVREGDVPPVELSAPFSLAADPIVDGTPTEIVRGFLNAGAAGLADEFTVARKFLTAGAAWDPRARVLIAGSQGLQVEERGEGQVTVSVPVTALVDEAGVYTEAAAQASQSLEFELVQDSADQWRISSPPEGVVMSPRDFGQLYRGVPVYFASPDLTHLVPDLRHFPTSNMATSAVTALLDGPSGWMRDAVVNGAPEAAALSVAAVTVAGTVATVDLAAPASMAGADRDLFQAQLDATLLSLPIGITEVAVTVGTLPWVANRPRELIVNPAPAAGPFVITDGTLAVVDQGQVIELPDVPSLAGLSVNRLALSPDGQVRVVRSGVSRLMLLPQDGEPQELLAGSRLVPPSIDRFTWVWSGPEVSDGSLIGVSPDGTTTRIAADWLEGAGIRSLRVARDGTRVAVVSVDVDGRVSVDVAGVVRDEDGVPLRLGPPWQIGASLTDATEVSWADEFTVAVLGTGAGATSPTMHLVPLGGPTDPLAMVEDTIGIATGRGPRAHYIVDRDGQLWLEQGEVWTVVATDVSDAAFPG